MSSLKLIFKLEIHQWFQWMRRIIFYKPPQVNRGWLWGPSLHKAVCEMYFWILKMVSATASCGFRRPAIRHEIKVTWYHGWWLRCCGDVAWLPEVHCKFVNRADETWINDWCFLYACQGPLSPAAVPGANRPELLRCYKGGYNCNTLLKPPKRLKFWGCTTGYAAIYPTKFRY